MSDAEKFSPLPDNTTGSSDSFASELDEYDLLHNAPTAKAPDTLPGQTDLSKTAKAFNSLIQRKKKEQEVVSEQAAKAARERHLLMLRALMNIRKSLRDLTRVDLGDRFKLFLFGDDWTGWPRLSIRLHDKEQTEQEYFPFVVTAHDRYDAGTIEISYSDHLPSEKVSVIRDGDLKRLPNLLRKCVRSYLDYVGDLVLEAERKKDQLVALQKNELEKKNIQDFTESASVKNKPDLVADLYEETFESDFLETLPSLDNVEALPELIERKKRI
ncbi:MAG TPA: hypothetical protein PLP17_14555 [Oligoflexia bacterium]|nr:hypothetical protein [Oligoflexia bacterium]